MLGVDQVGDERQIRVGRFLITLKTLGWILRLAGSMLCIDNGILPHPTLFANDKSG